MLNADASSAEMPRIMGRGLANLESVLPSTRGATLFGEVRRQLTESGAAELAISRGATGLGTAYGRMVRDGLESQHNMWEKVFYVSPRKRAEEAARVADAVRLGGSAGAFLGNAVWTGVQKFLDRKDAEGSAQRILHVVAFAARDDDGAIGLPNQALLARVLDAFNLGDAARTKVAGRPVPSALAELKDCGLDGPAREAVATFAFHACANEFGPDAAEIRILPLLMRLGITAGAGRALARSAHEEYLSEQDTVTFHYAVLQSAVAGIGLHLHLPMADIEAAARHVVAYNPYEAAREQNRRMLGALLEGGARLAAVAGTGHPGPALGIAASAAARLLGKGGAAEQPRFDQALAEYVGANRPALENKTILLNP